MKALYCTECGDIISPFRENMRPRWCVCRRFAVWWRDGSKGEVSVYDSSGQRRKAFILGITNSFLNFPLTEMTAEDIQEIIKAHPPNYLFKSRGTCIVRIVPGESTDSRWENDLPTSEDR